MAYAVQPFNGFGNGLNLSDKADAVDPADAIDAMNVEFTERGAVKQRAGYAQFTADPLTNPAQSLSPFYTSSGARQLLAGCGNRLEALDTDGEIVASATGLTDGIWDFARFGAPGTEVAYAGNGLDSLQKWDGSAWSSVSNTPKAGALAVMAVDQGNRMVAGRFLGTDGGPDGSPSSSNPSRVYFSDPGDPETWGTNNYIDFTPGDGEAVQAIVAWREFVFVFKETKFFRVDGSSEDAAGNPVFLYTTFDTGVGLATPRAITAHNSGVYFLSRTGIYRTNGGEAEYVSEPVEPIFLGGASPYYTGGTLLSSQFDNCAMCGCADGKRIYLGFTSSGTSNNRALLYDTEQGWWSLYDFPFAAGVPFQIGSAPELVFAGGSHIYRHNSSLTNDADAAIVSWWRSGWFDYGIPERKTIRESKVWGSGAPFIGVSVDYEVSEGSLTQVDLTDPTSVTWNGTTWGGATWVRELGRKPHLRRRAARGTVFSTTFRNSVLDQGWNIARLDHHLREQATESKVDR